MDFLKAIFPTFVGSVLGFIFSIVLFYITKKMERKTNRKAIEKSLLKEFEFNKIFMENLLKEINKAIQKITAFDTSPLYIKYSDFQSFFIQEYFKSGFLYEKIDPEDIQNLSKILQHMGFSENYVNPNIFEWQQGKKDKKELLGIMEFQRDSLEEHIKTLAAIKKKLSGKKK